MFNAAQLWARREVTGPVSFRLTVIDETRRVSLHPELLADVIV